MSTSRPSLRGESFVIADAFLNLLLSYLAIADPKVVIWGDDQSLGAVIDGEEHTASGHKA